MRPLLARESLWVYPVFGSLGGSFGYWLSGVEQRQTKVLTDRKNSLLEKRRRRDEREAAVAASQGDKTEGGGVLASTS